MRLAIALFVGKSVSLILKLKGSGATAAPGYYALKIDKNLVKKLNAQIGKTIVISGTNGKTTTSRIISDLASTEYNVIHNRQGSNLLRGIASTLINNSSPAGKIHHNLALWETDEAQLPDVLSQTNPQTVVLLNLFRDQLDRYGEVESVRKKWEEAIGKLSPETTLLLNADDPQVSFIERSFKGKAQFFGVEDKKLDLPPVENVADAKFCLNCGNKLNYEPVFSAHLGHWSCPSCSLKRKKTQFGASNLKFNSDLTSDIRLSTSSSGLSISYPLPGLYNVYNVIAATSVAIILGLDEKTIKNSLNNFEPAFGRFQKITIKGKKAVVFLIKNPAGANEVIRTASILKNVNLLAILNDKLADGRDVSWIWDTNWEALNSRVKDVTTAGIRAWDMALRLKYAGFNMSKNSVYEDISYSLEKSLDQMNSNSTLLILPTYTAMLELQKKLKKYGGAKWQKQ